MNGKVQRQTVDLSAFPYLVVIYLGMRVNTWMGVKTLLGMGPQINKAVDRKPDGLLLHEYFLLALIPPHLGMRQYWRDFDALEAWSRSEPHREWWRELPSVVRRNRVLARDLLHAPDGAVYDDVRVPLGFGRALVSRAQRRDVARDQNALVERERLALAALVAGGSRAQHRQAGLAQPVRGHIPGRTVILDHGDDRGLLQRTCAGELPRLCLRRRADRPHRGT